MKLLTLTWLPAALALPHLPWHDHGPPTYPGHGSGVKAAYFLDNNPAGSSIASLKVGSDGTLSDPIRTSTGGIGSIGTNTTGFPNPADSLMSQGSVTISGDMLFTVNAGSNTVAMFHIDPKDPWHPQMVGKPADTQGQFPMSVAYSSELKMACVLNGGAVAGVSCFHVDSHHGLQAQGSLRSLGGTINQTTPPTGPPGSAGQITFDPASKGVFALIKGDAGAMPAEVGSIVAFSASHDGVSSDPVISQFDNVFMDFSGIWLSDTRLYMTDPAFGIAYLDLQTDLKFTQAVHTVIPTQVAICWNAYDATLDTAYAIDAGQNTIYELDAASGALKGNITIKTDRKKKDVGLFDTALIVQTSLVYTLAGSNGIAVTNVATGEEVQYLDLSSFGDRQGYMGMALFLCRRRESY